MGPGTERAWFYCQTPLHLPRSATHIITAAAAAADNDDITDRVGFDRLKNISLRNVIPCFSAMEAGISTSQDTALCAPAACMIIACV